MYLKSLEYWSDTVGYGRIRYDAVTADFKNWKNYSELIMLSLKDKYHPTTINLTKSSQRDTRSNFPFEAPIAKNERFNKSFVPKTLRGIRDGISSKYQPSTTKNTHQVNSTITTNAPIQKTTCIKCGRIFKTRGIKTHQRSCNQKQ